MLCKSTKLLALFSAVLLVELITTLSVTEAQEVRKKPSSSEGQNNNTEAIKTTDSSSSNGNSSTLGGKGEKKKKGLGCCGWWGGGGGGCGWIEVNPNSPENRPTEAPFIPNVPPPFPLNPSCCCDRCRCDRRGDGNPCLPDCDICACDCGPCNCDSCGPCRHRRPSGPTCESIG